MGRRGCKTTKNRNGKDFLMIVLFYGLMIWIAMVFVNITKGESKPETMIVSKHRVPSCTKTMMECIERSKRHCETVNNSKDMYETCRVDKTLVLEMGTTFAILQHIDNSSMTCLNGTTLHRGVLNWEMNKIFDTCSYRIKIEARYYPIQSESSNKITFSEKTKCKGNQTCPSKSYYSDEIVPRYRKLENGPYIWIDFAYIDKTAELTKQRTGSPDASPETVNSSPSHVTCPWCICLCVGILKIIL